MNRQSGFSIIECLVYCSLFCFLCILIFGWVGASQVSLTKIHKKSRHLLDTYGSLDAFVQDAMGAPSDSSAWKKVSEHELVWQGHEGAIGWAWSEGSLYRTTGIYADRQWTQSTKNLVSSSLNRVNFTVHRNKIDQVVSIACDFEGRARRIVLRNRSFDGKA